MIKQIRVQFISTWILKDFQVSSKVQSVKLKDYPTDRDLWFQKIRLKISGIMGDRYLDNLENSLTVTLVDHSNNYDETKINSECICFFTVEDNVPTQVFRKVKNITVAKPSFVHHKRLKFHVSRYVFIVHAFESFSHIFCTNLEWPHKTGEINATNGKDVPSYDVVKHWHSKFRCGGNGSIPWEKVPSLPLIRTPSIKWRLLFWKITVLLFAS